VSLLEVVGLTKSFRGRYGPLGLRRRAIQAVRNVSFTLDEGQTLALIGESGSGKSTTARLITRLIEPDGGSVNFEGEDLLEMRQTELRRTRARLAMVFQDPNGSLDPRVTIGDSVGEPLLVHNGLHRKERENRVASLLERVGLSPRHMSRYPRELSGGQVQRAAIARAITTNPKLIVCDEPVTALDVIIRAQIINLLSDLQNEFGIAYLFISHDLNLVRAFADSVLVMLNGEIVDRGTAQQIVSNPGHAHTRDLLAAIPSLVPKALRSGGTFEDMPTSGPTSIPMGAPTGLETG